MWPLGVLSGMSVMALLRLIHNICHTHFITGIEPLVWVWVDQDPRLPRALWVATLGLGKPKPSAVFLKVQSQALACLVLMLKF